MVYVLVGVICNLLVFVPRSRNFAFQFYTTSHKLAHIGPFPVIQNLQNRDSPTDTIYIKHGQQNTNPRTREMMEISVKDHTKLTC